MDFGTFASWMVVGVLAGWVAGFVMKGEGTGRSGIWCLVCSGASQGAGSSGP